MSVGCPACGFGGELTMTVSSINHVDGTATLAATGFVVGDVINLGWTSRPRLWRRILRGFRAFWMAVRR